MATGHEMNKDKVVYLSYGLNIKVYHLELLLSVHTTNKQQNVMMK